MHTSLHVSRPLVHAEYPPESFNEVTLLQIITKPYLFQNPDWFALSLA